MLATALSNGVPGALDKPAKWAKVSLQSSAKRPTFHALSDLAWLLPAASCLVVAAKENAQLYLAVARENQAFPLLNTLRR
jgi:hypothetical protein